MSIKTKNLKKEPPMKPLPEQPIIELTLDLTGDLIFKTEFQREKLLVRRFGNRWKLFYDLPYDREYLFRNWIYEDKDGIPERATIEVAYEHPTLRHRGTGLPLEYHFTKLSFKLTKSAKAFLKPRIKIKELQKQIKDLEADLQELQKKYHDLGNENIGQEKEISRLKDLLAKIKDEIKGSRFPFLKRQQIEKILEGNKDAKA